MDNGNKRVRQRKSESTTNGDVVDTTVTPSATTTYTSEEMKALREQERQDREKLLLWKKPLMTLLYFVFEAGCLVNTLIVK